MECRFFDGWFLSEARERIRTVCYGSDLTIMKLRGERLFRSGDVGGGRLVNLLVLEGGLTLTANGKRMSLASPAYIDFIGSNIWSWRDLVTSSDFDGRLFGMTEPFFRETVDVLNVKIGDRLFDYMRRPFWSLEPDDGHRLCRLLDILFDTMERSRHIAARDFLQNMFRAYLSELMDIVFRRREMTKSDMARNKSDILLRFLYLLNEHYLECHEVKWYAERLCISPDALSAVLKKAYGKNANRFIDERLIEKAEQCLSDGRYSVQQVADMLNFSDQSAFGKFFKRITGISPKAFQEAGRKMSG